MLSYAVCNLLVRFALRPFAAVCPLLHFPNGNLAANILCMIILFMIILFYDYSQFAMFKFLRFS